MINAVSNVPLLRNCSINYCISPTARAVGYRSSALRGDQLMSRQTGSRLWI